jgi:hypothetical protein
LGLTAEALKLKGRPLTSRRGTYPEMPAAFPVRNSRASEDQLIDFATQWESVALNYLYWLRIEGFDFDRSINITNSALDFADFVLGKFPICGEL